MKHHRPAGGGQDALNSGLDEDTRQKLGLQIQFITI